MPCSFLEFLWIWDQIQKLKLPRHHRQMAHFLTNLYDHRKSGLLMAFRDSGKSTVIGVFCCWLLLQNPDIRILILSADQILAKKMVHHIRQVLECHPLTRQLRPTVQDEWASHRFTVKRRQQLRDPSVSASGLMSNITGSRADIIICDDVEVPKTSNTAQKRDSLRQKLSELDYILTPQGLVIYIGTPHTYDTIYRTDADGFLKDWAVLKVPLIGTDGSSAWPERFDSAYIKDLRRRTGPNKFASQMMLEPLSPTDSRLDPGRLRLYTGDLVYREANERAILSLNSVQLSGVSCWWDPAFGSPTGDKSVVACVFFDSAGNAYIHRLLYLSVPPATEATAYQCAQVRDLVQECFIPAIHLETNGIGKFLPALLRQEFAKTRTSCAVLEETSHSHKSDRIIAAFDAPLMNGSLWINSQIRQTPFFQEMRDFIPDSSGHDDGLDAIAGCLLSEPVRFPKYTGSFQKNYSEWRF